MDSIDNELQNLSNKDNSDWKKFTPLATGVGNCLFIGTTVSNKNYKCIKKKRYLNNFKNPILD